MATTLSFGDILDNVLLDRFPASVRARARLSVNNRLMHLWNMESWTFKYATANPTTSTTSAALDGMPSDFGTVEDLWNENGDRLPDITPREYYDLYLTGGPGTPEAYTVINGQVLIGPAPVSAVTWTMFYEKRLTLLDAETDIPAIPAECHPSLIHGARAELLAAYNDPTASDQEQQWQLDLDAMRRQYLSDVAGEPSRWPSDPASYLGFYGAWSSWF